MIPKISSKVGILGCLTVSKRNIVPIDTLKQLYNARVQPHFDYGNVSMTLQLRQTRLDFRNYRLEMQDR